MNHRDKVVSPIFDTGDYKGQDVVHQGIRIPLAGDPHETASKFSRRARRIIGSQHPGLFRILQDSDLEALRKIWFDPMDPTFPETLGEHRGLVGLDTDGTIIAGAVWAPQGNNLFLHQLVASERGLKLHMPTRLIWESLLDFHARGFHAIEGFKFLDIGVSYNPKRYEFFKNFAVETYPIILKKPFYVPVIRLAPFRNIQELKENPDDHFWKERNGTFFPRASYAIYGVLKRIGVGEGDQVMVVKTFDGTFLSRCVSDMIEKTGASWYLLEPGARLMQPRAVIVVHEFGVPLSGKKLAFVRSLKEQGIKIIEDCAWRARPGLDFSDYQIYSLQKLYDLNYGGILVGAHLDDEFMWSIGCLDKVKRERLRYEKEQLTGLAQRTKLWMQYDALVKADGMTRDDRVDWDQELRNGWLPTVYMQRFADDETANAIVQRLEDFGIQAGRYWPDPVVYLPIHQNMSSEEVEYMFAVVRGYFNLCRDYGIKKI